MLHSRMWLGSTSSFHSFWHLSFYQLFVAFTFAGSLDLADSWTKSEEKDRPRFSTQPKYRKEQFSTCPEDAFSRVYTFLGGASLIVRRYDLFPDHGNLMFLSPCFWDVPLRQINVNGNIGTSNLSYLGSLTMSSERGWLAIWISYATCTRPEMYGIPEHQVWPFVLIKFTTHVQCLLDTFIANASFFVQHFWKRETNVVDRNPGNMNQHILRCFFKAQTEPRPFRPPGPTRLCTVLWRRSADGAGGDSVHMNGWWEPNWIKMSYHWT